MIKSRRAFTLIELLVVIAIIGVLATISVIALSNARAKSRDAKRVGNMKQIQTALELFYNDNARYPTLEEWSSGTLLSTSSNATTTYMKIIPTAPTPADGDCSESENALDYIQTEDGASYSISFCVGNTVGIVSSGAKDLTPAGIVSDSG
ncbi:MAG: prepilin-type N-terminal cleavage/methylation domain-containing protein, partial [Patescibacteria group bacterium]